MNYVGNDRNYEMPEDVLRMLFDEKANKRLKNHKILFDTEHSEIPYSLDQALAILNRFGEEFHHNTGCDRSLNVVKRRKTVKEGIGNNEAAIVNRLEWFVKKEIPLVISTVPSTYEYGILQPMNKAVLDTLIQSITMNDSHLTEKVLRLV